MVERSRTLTVLNSNTDIFLANTPNTNGACILGRFVQRTHTSNTSITIATSANVTTARVGNAAVRS